MLLLCIIIILRYLGISLYNYYTTHITNGNYRAKLILRANILTHFLKILREQTFPAFQLLYSQIQPNSNRQLSLSIQVFKVDLMDS